MASNVRVSFYLDDSKWMIEIIVEFTQSREIGENNTRSAHVSREFLDLHVR